MLIDLLLPGYDITQGENLYDEILAVEFCTSLAKHLCDDSNVSPFSAILVRDGKGERLARRVLEANEQKRADEVKTNATDEDDMTARDEVKQNFDSIESSGVVFEDDLDGIGSSNAGFVDDVELIRQQLTSMWNETADLSVNQDSEGSEMTATSKDREQRPTSTKNISQLQTPSKSKCYRIGSLLGDEPISRGPDMFDDVINAVDKHAVQSSDDTIIILSALCQEEMIAVRRIIARYEEKKTIILVNCKLNPMPRELLGAEIVYSLLPLVAKTVQSTESIFDKQVSNNKPNPKVVVLRRYPRDWEVFVDLDGSGFDLAASVSAEEVESKGPSMDWIARCVKRYTASKTGI